MTAARPVTPAPDLGSPELAAALAAGDPLAVGHALQTGWVVVPVQRGPQGATELRLFEGLDAARPGWELPLFSSVEALHRFLADDPQREFEFVFGPSLADTLAATDRISRVVFDPADAHAAAADADEIRTILASAPRPAAVPTGIRPSDRALDLHLPLDEPDWLRIDLTAPDRDAQIAAIVDRQLQGLSAGPTLRTQLAQWLRRLARTAEGGGGRETAFLVRRTDDAALALSVTRYWNRLGPAPADAGHLDALARRLAAQPGHGDLVTAELSTGRLLRHVRVTAGDAQLGAEAIAVLSADYWLEFPDRRGLCLVSFSSPHADVHDAIVELCDEIVVAGSWVIAGADETDGRGGSDGSGGADGR